jgi:hypothetical protein
MRTYDESLKTYGDNYSVMETANWPFPRANQPMVSRYGPSPAASSYVHA